MRVPNPRCVGGVAVGPPDSIQRKLSLRFAVTVLQEIGLQNPRGELSRLVFTLVRTVPSHIGKPTGFPSVPGEGNLLNDIGG
jgi:hypothetical protein